jgi:TolB-like protein/DNA-binding winged helix-turn-helix (wHTH) protein/Flp pilus assembly protein TadD
VKCPEIDPHPRFALSGTPSSTVAYEFGEFRLDPARRLLARGGTPIAITDKPFDALIYLVEHAGTVVTRRQLSDALWPSTVVEDNNLSQTVLALRRALGDTQDGARFIATVPRRGYQFVAEVRRSAGGEAAPVRMSVPTADPRAARAVGRWRSLRPAVSLAAALLAVAGWYGLRNLGEPAEPARAAASSATVSPGSVAVLPFQNLSPLEEHAYFAAGMHEEVLSQLGRIQGLEVKGRTSVLRYGDGVTPLETIASELRVATVLEGSVRYASGRVRVSVRLVDDGGTERWSEVYDAPLDDVFAIQADIAERIAAELAAEVTPAERSSIAVIPTESLPAYAFYLEALALYRSRGGIGVSMPLGVRKELDRLLGESLALDADFAAPLGWRAHIALDSLMFDARPAADWHSVSAELTQRIEADAARALELDPKQEMAHVALARLDLYRWRFDDARNRLARAHALRPSDSAVQHYAAMVAIMLDDYAAAVRAARRALELDPQNPAPYTPLGIALRALGDQAGAVDAARAMIELAPGAPIGYINLARTETASGDPQRVREALRVAERFFDDTTRNFRADAALAYASAAMPDDARRLISDFERTTAGSYVGPGVGAMARLAVRDYAGARDLLEHALATRTSGMDPMPLLLIRLNTWTDPTLEEPDWQALRERLRYVREP